MEINKQLFEDVLSGKLKGTFVLRSGEKICSSANLHRNYNKFKVTHPYALGVKSYTPKGLYCESVTCVFDIVDFIPEYKTIDLEMLEYCRKDFEFMQTLSKAINNMNTLEIEIPEGQEIDWQESAKQKKIVFKKKDNKPRSWEEYCNNFKGELFYFGNRNSIESVIANDGMSYMAKDYLPSKELAEAFIAMMQIMSLRQAWIGNWNSNQLGYAIMLDVQRNIIASHDVYPTALTFPDRNMAVDFMNTFKDLLEIAKPLI